jgi:hypothetical protein
LGSRMRSSPHNEADCTCLELRCSGEMDDTGAVSDVSIGTGLRYLSSKDGSVDPTRGELPSAY